MPYPYTPPAFLQNQSADEIHRRMLNALPEDIDKSEVQIPWDFTRPPALEKAEFVEFELNETIKIIFPQWAYGNWLDLHAQMEAIDRRPANRASGDVTVTAFENTVIPEGFQFATVASISASVIFEATAEVAFTGTPDSKGQVTASVPVRAIDGGKNGNVPPDTIKLMVKPLTGIVYISNDNPLTGGTEEERDDDLRDRVLDVIRRGISFVGCDADYVRWAQEVPAVGQVVVDPEWDDPNMPAQFHYIDEKGVERCAGAVRLFIVDSNGVPANEQILAAVYEHIVSPDNRSRRLAPIGATVTVVPPTPVDISISALVLLAEFEDIATVTARFKERLNTYWLQAAAELSVKYAFVWRTLAETPGVANFTALQVNGATDDIPIALGEFPVTGEVTLD